MKFLILTLALGLTHAHASEVTCVSNVTSQSGTTLKTDAKLNFKLTANGNQSTISNVNGYVYVMGAYEDKNEPMTAENTYMGFFKAGTLVANAKYRPNQYKGFAQFQNFNAIKTTGLEDGMWGNLVAQVEGRTSSGKIAAHYIFQAGDHMGGTVHFSCSVKDEL